MFYLSFSWLVRKILLVKLWNRSMFGAYMPWFADLSGGRTVSPHPPPWFQPGFNKLPQIEVLSHQYPTMMTMNQSVLLTSLCLFNYLAQRLAGCWSFGSLVSWVTASLRTTTQNPAGNCSFMRTLKHRLQSDLVTWTTSGYTQGKPNHKQPSKIIHKLGKL